MTVLISVSSSLPACAFSSLENKPCASYNREYVYRQSIGTWQCQTSISCLAYSIILFIFAMIIYLFWATFFPLLLHANGRIHSLENVILLLQAAGEIVSQLAARVGFKMSSAGQLQC